MARAQGDDASATFLRRRARGAADPKRSLSLLARSELIYDGGKEVLDLFRHLIDPRKGEPDQFPKLFQLLSIGVIEIAGLAVEKLHG